MRSSCTARARKIPYKTDCEGVAFTIEKDSRFVEKHSKRNEPQGQASRVGKSSWTWSADGRFYWSKQQLQQRQSEEEHAKDTTEDKSGPHEEERLTWHTLEPIKDE